MTNRTGWGSALASFALVGSTSALGHWTGVLWPAYATTGLLFGLAALLSVWELRGGSSRPFDAAGLHLFVFAGVSVALAVVTIDTLDELLVLLYTLVGVGMLHQARKRVRARSD